MAVAADAKPATLLELRSAALTLVAVVLKATDLTVLAHELTERVAMTPDLFDHDAVAVDLSRVRDHEDPIDFPALVALLRRHRLVPVAARGGNAQQMAAALDAGLAEAPDGPPGGGALLLTETVREVMLPPPPALVVERPVRAGQQLVARGGDMVVLALVNPGAELLADGSIHVYAPLRGRAFAGVKGDRAARIYTTCLQAELLSVAGVHGSGEAAVPSDLLGRAAMVRLHDDGQLRVEALPG